MCAKLGSTLMKYVIHKYKNIVYQTHIDVNWKSISFSNSLLDSLCDELTKALHSKRNNSRTLTDEERNLVTQIRRTTAEKNKNNVTRAEGYRDIYFRHKELHWAFLAHMVTRNGGWNMTDLKGALIPKLLGTKNSEDFFQFLERANVLIFHDAYPQLLLYEESKKRNQNLSYLLPALQISAFMKPFWDEFWKSRNAQLLSLALIINEQNYIEGRVVQNPYFKAHVLSDLTFKTQAILQLNQVIFPYLTNRSSKVRLAGLVLEDFSNLQERIDFGKKLYSLLFGIPSILQGAEAFAQTVVHSASRADYWPNLFTKEAVSTGSNYTPPYYSPTLENAWENQPMKEAELYDWFVDLTPMKYLQKTKTPFLFDMTDEHRNGIDRIVMAVSALEHVKA